MDESINSNAIEETPVPPPLVEVAVEVPPPAAPPEIPAPSRPAPIAESERYQTLDVIRGMALCGILLVNMESFAMVREARYDPALSGGDSMLNHLVWQITYLLADTKFIAIFTMLFGAGIAMADQRRQDRGLSSTRMVHYRRMLFLLTVGAAHGLFLWRGDILYFYAFWGIFLYAAPRLPALELFVFGMGIYAWFVSDFSRQLLDVGDGYSFWERDIFQGAWQEQYRYRLEFETLYLRDLPIEFATHLVGLMLVGMALFKARLLAGRGPGVAYALFAAATFALGFGLVADGTKFSTGFVGEHQSKEFVWGSLLLTFSYMSAAVAATKLIGLRFGIGGLAAMGRMAFTNYLMQTVICTTIFYGYGFGLFEHTTRVEQFGIIVAILAFQMIFSLAWLRFFRFGPLEWIWRSFTYWRVQPLLRERMAPAAPSVVI